MAYSKAKLKSSGDKASPCFRPFSMLNLLDRFLPIRISYFSSFQIVKPSQPLPLSVPLAYKEKTAIKDAKHKTTVTLARHRVS
jgi:hypothetical protein